MKNKKKIIGVLALVTLIVSIFIAGYTFARYYKKVDTTATATIARWSFGSKNAEAEISLSNEKIAPGSNGQFEIEVDATDSEVAVDYEVKVVDSQNIPRNMTFRAITIDEKGNQISETTSYNSFEQLASENLVGNIPVENGNQKRSIIVYWDWAFNSDDQTTTDSEDGTLVVDSNGNSSLDCLFNIEIIGKQAQ